jgi:hypothetical protein
MAGQPQSSVLKQLFTAMAINIKRGTFDPEDGSFQYELQFKPVVDDDEILSSVAVEVAFSVSENGELADITFMVPKSVRNDQAMKFLRQECNASYVDSRMFIVMPGTSGDTVLRAPAQLELDAAGRIVSLKIN